MGGAAWAQREAWTRAELRTESDLEALLADFCSSS